MRILLVEDNRDILANLADYLGPLRKKLRLGPQRCYVHPC